MVPFSLGEAVGLLGLCECYSTDSHSGQGSVFFGAGFCAGEIQELGTDGPCRQRSCVRDHCTGAFSLSVFWKPIPSCCSVGRAWPDFPRSRWRGQSPRCSHCTWFVWGGRWGHGARCELCHCASPSLSGCAWLPPRQEKLVEISEIMENL